MVILSIALNELKGIQDSWGPFISLLITLIAFLFNNLSLPLDTRLVSFFETFQLM